MNFELTPQQKAVQQSARQFAQTVLQETVLEDDAAGRFPEEAYKKMGEMGFVGLPFPKEYGGQGGDYLSYVLALEEISKINSSVGIAYSVCTSLYSGALINDGNEYPVQTVMKALELLNHLAKNTGNLGAGVSELSDALGIGKSTVHRLLDTLQYYGYIEKSEETNRYRLGWELYKVGLSVPAQNQLFNIDRTHLLELGKKLNETIDYGTIKGKETIIISKMEYTSNGMNNSVSPGEYESIHATALGKVMISEMSEEEIYKLFEDKEELPAYTPHTILTVSELIHEAEKVKKHGYGVNDEEYWIGMYCMAVPVRNYTGKIVAAVSASIPVFRVDDKKKEFVLDELNRTAGQISKELGYLG